METPPICPSGTARGWSAIWGPCRYLWVQNPPDLILLVENGADVYRWLTHCGYRQSRCTLPSDSWNVNKWHEKNTDWSTKLSIWHVKHGPIHTVGFLFLLSSAAPCSRHSGSSPPPPTRRLHFCHTNDLHGPLWWSVYLIWQTFYARCPSWRNPPHLSGLGTGTGRTLDVVLQWLGYIWGIILTQFTMSLQLKQLQGLMLAGLVPSNVAQCQESDRCATCAERWGHLVNCYEDSCIHEGETVKLLIEYAACEISFCKPELNIFIQVAWKNVKFTFRHMNWLLVFMYDCFFYDLCIKIAINVAILFKLNITC